MKLSVEEIGARMDALGLWDVLEPYNWAIKPRGTVFPYFCLLIRADGKPVRWRLLLLEGWQTLHDFVRTRMDRNFGFYTTPAEMPHYELIFLQGEGCKLFRHDPGYVPQPAREDQREFVSRLLWEAFGIMLRVEGDQKLPLKFASDKAVFARVEKNPGEWADEPLPIPEPRPVTEQVALAKADLRAAQDLPLDTAEKLSLDFRMLPGLMTKEARPRTVYELLAVESATGAQAFASRVSASPEGGLKGLWEEMPAQVLKRLVARGHVPGEIRVRSGRVFRMLRALCLELPLKLSLHDDLPELKESNKA